ncbi:MAG TPA: amidohydrolase family protein [Gemmatimonadales bacterium]|nr:amidohydrolase family protein [Gemmatimonadales bacterium]
MRRLSADWLVPMNGEPMPGGAVLIGPAGRIESVGAGHAVPEPPGTHAAHYPGCIIVPGLVNAHTHLELTGLAGAIDAPDFADWIRRIIALKATFDYGHFLAAARQGVADCFAAGVTTIADTGDSGAVIEALFEAGGSGVVYHEVFGPDPAQCEASLLGLQERVRDRRRFTSERIAIGVSPHAPYTVSGPLYRAVAEWARSEGLPVATHLAEPPGEISLFRDGTGSLAEMWMRRGIALPGAAITPIEWLDRHGALGAELLCVHVVHAGSEDIARMKRAEVGVAHCPLSNRAHAHGAAPLRALLEAGLRVGCGTDSVVSVGRLDLLAEARAARELAGLDAASALALCTRDAAQAIGLGEQVGTLTAGKWGDVTIVRAGSADSATHACERVLASGTGDVAETVVAGRTVFRRRP